MEGTKSNARRVARIYAFQNMQLLESSLIGIKLNALATAEKSNCEASEEEELWGDAEEEFKLQAIGSDTM